jgi:hypothetical protein
MILLQVTKLGWRKRKNWEEEGRVLKVKYFVCAINCYLFMWQELLAETEIC